MTRTVDHIIIHCSATKATADIGAVDIDRWHREKGWFGCGYHFIIRRDGTLESEALGKRCRSLAKPGAHVGDCGAGWNKRSIGICMAGGVAANGKPENNFTPEQFITLEALIKELREQHPDTRIMGHRDLIKETKAPPKACPSFEVTDWLKTVGVNPKPSKD